MRYAAFGQTRRAPHAFSGSNWSSWLVSLMHAKGVREQDFDLHGHAVNMGTDDSNDGGVVVIFDEEKDTMKLIRTIGREDWIKTEAEQRALWIERQAKKLNGYKVKWSLDHRAYYLPDVTTPRGFWLTHPPIKREPTEEEKKNGIGFMAPMSQFQLPTGERYLRGCYPFAFYEIKSDHTDKGETVESADSDLVLDYLSTAKNWDK